MKWAAALGMTVLVAQLFLVWNFEFFPTIDGPAHVHLAHAMYETLRGDEFFYGLVELNRNFNPNVATQGVLVALMMIAPPFIAEKLWLSLYFASFTFAAYYALLGISRSSLCLLPLMVFCSISFPLAFGFYNFSFSAVIFLAWFGYWWRNRAIFRWRIVLGHAALAALAYATHVYALIVSLLAIGLAGSAAICDGFFRGNGNPDGPPRSGLRTIVTHSLPPLLGSLPVLVACAHLLFGRFGSQTSAGASRIAASDPLRFHELVTGTSLAPYDAMEQWAVAAFLVLTLVLAAALLRSGRLPRSSLPIAFCLAGFVAVYMVMPPRWIVRWMPDRFQPMVFLMLLLFVATLMPSNLRRYRWNVIAAFGTAVLVLSVAIRYQVFSRIDGFYQELASMAPHIRERSSLVGLRLHTWLEGRPFPARLDVLIQSGSRIASMRHSVDLKNFQGQSNDHPIQFRPGVSATAALGGDPAVTGTPPVINLMAYEMRTGRPIDYVYVYGFRDAVADRGALERLEEQLDRNYRLSFVSQPTGLVHLYERRRDEVGFQPVASRVSGH